MNRAVLVASATPAVAGAGNRGFDHSGHAGRDLALHREDFAELAVVPLGPNMNAGGRINQLSGDPQPIAGAANAALKGVADAKIAPDLPDIYRPVPVSKRGVAIDHEQGTNVGERCGDVFHQAATTTNST